jgi:mannosyltransferase OCH1-like enzyme
MNIPKVIHMVWIGDESRRPDTLINSWRDKNPEWKIKVWGNRELAETRWINHAHINSMKPRSLAGVADMMRYEILLREGGFAVDADTCCIRPLADWLFDSQVCVAWENEIIRPGLLANCFIAAEPEAALMSEVILTIKNKPSVVDNLPWITTGPKTLTDTVNRLNYANITRWPSHYFIPHHFTGTKYLGNGNIFAYQLWGTTRGINDQLADIAL